MINRDVEFNEEGAWDWKVNDGEKYDFLLILDEEEEIYEDHQEPIVISTTRKPDKTNRITDGNILSVIFTDGHNSVSKFVGIYRRPKSISETVGIYRWTISVGVYRPFHRWGIPFVWKYATAW